jgi:hemerythrin-like domain-containing protein
MNAEINITENEASPFSPPDAYSPPKVDEEIPYENMHKFLQILRDEHDEFSKKVTDFEKTIMQIEGGKVDREIDKQLRVFFEYFDEEIRVHNLKEEKALFPIISKKMNEEGSHSKGIDNFNAIDVLEDEHSQFIQLSAVVFNFFALFSRIPDERSRIIVLDAAIAESRAFVELVRVHIFREETIVFSYAHRNFSDDDFSKL